MPDLSKKIMDMKVGETGFAVPWVGCYDENRNLYINTMFTIADSPENSHRVPIIRTGEGIADYIIDDPDLLSASAREDPKTAFLYHEREYVVMLEKKVQQENKGQEG